MVDIGFGYLMILKVWVMPMGNNKWGRSKITLGI